MLDLLARVGDDVLSTLAGTWPFLAISVLAAAALNVYVGADRLAGWMRRRTAIAVGGAVVLAAATPFCSCGTTAVALGMIATSAPWAPIVAFMVASPLTSPSELVLSAGLLGWPFALIFFGGTIVLGIGAGLVTAGIEQTGLLRGQARMTPAGERSPGKPASCTEGSCAVSTESNAKGFTTLSLGPGAAAVTEIGTLSQRLRLRELGREVVSAGRRMAVFFLAFTALGYLVIEAVPTAWLQEWLGGDSPLAVVGAALLGVPAYVNTEGSLPLVAGLMNGGMGPGPAMAFLVTGAGTSVGAVTGMLAIARRRVVALVVAVLFAGAVLLGAATQVLLG